MKTTKTPYFKLLSTALAAAFAFGTLLTPSTSAAFEKFVCTCQATGPGVERVLTSVKKYCSYDCSCIGLNSSGPAVMGIPASIQNVVTSSYSLEDWDYKSQTCHGQYAWRPSFDAPAWKIKAKFSPFTVTSEGVLIYPESIETAQGVHELGKKFKEGAPEIVEELRRQIP